MLQPDDKAGHPPETWHVYTDGSSRHERRQTFSGWAARAVQPQTRQVRQVSGAGPGGDSLGAETTAILEGLRLVPAGASVLLHSDLDPALLLTVLESGPGEAARAHLRGVDVHPILRHTAAHHRDMHDAARAAEREAREGASLGSASLPNAVQDAQLQARAGRTDAVETRGPVRRLPGLTGPLRLWVRGVTSGRAAGSGRTLVTLTLDLPDVQGTGPTETAALGDALEGMLLALTRGTLIHLQVPERWREAVAAAMAGHGAVRVVPEPEEPTPPAEDG
ncbi:hypothetical protein [Deinococcus aestuarii]|uniref:hypothetical protein n=1 Tax=Deinococcus aestuarii TaxID=2774531 RepID=UPI001C0B65CB|nr:hypothetical protein [Deinococcus aestuarii]